MQIDCSSRGYTQRNVKDYLNDIVSWLHAVVVQLSSISMTVTSNSTTVIDIVILVTHT